MNKKFVIKGKSVDGWTPIKMLDGTGLTFLNDDGHIMPHRFAGVSEFHDEMAIVEMKDGEKDRRITYVSKYEKLFDLRFSSALPFYGDTATACIGNEEYFVDKNGLCYQFKNTIIDKLIPATEKDKSGIFIFDYKNNKLFTTIFSVLGKANEGMMPISMKDGSGQTFIDKHYNIMRHRFLEVGKFRGGLAPAITFSQNLVYVDKFGNIYTEKQIEKMSEEYMKFQQEQLMNFEYYDLGLEEENDDDYDENEL